jgi:rRNA-processing protein EBP2
LKRSSCSREVCAIFSFIIHLLIIQFDAERKDGEDLTLNDDFDIALDKADTNKRAKTDKKSAPVKSQKRMNKDIKYGSGGKKGRFAKSNTLESTSGLGGYNKMKGKPIFKGKGKTFPSKKTK